MATLSLINFPKFSESKEFLKIGRSEVCVWGGGAKGETIKLSRSVLENTFSIFEYLLIHTNTITLLLNRKYRKTVMPS